MNLPRLLIISLLLGIIHPCLSQEHQAVVRSNITQEINGVEYYLHEVKKGETLSAISRAYHVKLDDITESNLGITDRIKPGDIIKIPARPDKQSTPRPGEGGMNYRRVAAGETLYSLSKEYNVSIEEIKAANGGLPDGLKTGSFIKIPVRDRTGETPGEQHQEQAEKEWIEYQAKERISIYELAIKYRVSVDMILELNPGIDEKLSPGQIIKLPLEITPETFVLHTVRQRQTMNRLARKYNMDVDQLKKANPYISRHLLEGQVIRIPLPELEVADIDDEKVITDEDLELTERTRDKSEKEVCHDMYHMGSYNVALVLPFFLQTYDSVRMVMESEPENREPEFIKPFVFLQFYEGFMLAVDSMKKAGLNVKLHVYDLEDDVQQAKKMLKNPELKNMDLIIGPVYGNTFKIFADFATEHRINIVNPLSTRIETTFGNPHVFQPQPVIFDQNKILVDFLNKEHDFSQIFIARHNAYRDELAMNELKNALNKDLESRPDEFTSLYHEIIFSRDSTYTFEHLASVDHENVVVVFSERKVFILDILRSLNELRDTFNITVIGMPEWKEIEGLEAEHLNNLNAHIFARDFANYDNPVVSRFVMGFRENFATEPNSFAFTGYNIGVYFLGALMKYGPSIHDCIRYFDMELLNMGFDFESPDPQNGFRNENWKILRMEDYRYRDISPRLKTYDLSEPPEKFYKYMENDIGN